MIVFWISLIILWYILHSQYHQDDAPPGTDRWPLNMYTDRWPLARVAETIFLLIERKYRPGLDQFVDTTHPNYQLGNGWEILPIKRFPNILIDTQKWRYIITEPSSELQYKFAIGCCHGDQMFDQTWSDIYIKYTMDKDGVWHLSTKDGKHQWIGVRRQHAYTWGDGIP